MDFISHTLWGYSLFGFRGNPKTSLAFGAMPDLISFGPVFVGNLINGTHKRGRPEISQIPDWSIFAYDFSHSLLCASLAILLVAKLNKGVAWAMLAWPAHILLDIPFHTKNYFPTKMFWPLTDFSIDGISWGTPVVWYTQLVLLFTVLAFRFRFRKQTN
jgi:membrane-bound metal-dependent hydrolase YbcI (DUF457 family)